MKTDRSIQASMTKKTNFQRAVEKVCRTQKQIPSLWEDVIRKIDLEAKCQVPRHIPEVDYSVVLPKRLRNRVDKIIGYDFDEYDKKALLDENLTVTDTPEDMVQSEDESDAPKTVRRDTIVEKLYHESENSDVERLENEFDYVDLKMSSEKSKGPIKKVKVDKRHWLARYICKERRDRVVWKSKIYDMNPDPKLKTLDEQAEDLMDSSAEAFTEWLNTVGSEEKTGITKEKLKALFSIEGDRTLLTSIHTEPKEVHAIAKTVADKWNIPDMAIELKYEGFIKERVNRKTKPKILSAFGRTMSNKLHPWVPSEKEKLIQTIFPDELMSREKVFKGIHHLRSTAALVTFYRRHPNVKRPKFLVEHGMFDHRSSSAEKTDVPLYEKLKLKY